MDTVGSMYAALFRPQQKLGKACRVLFLQREADRLQVSMDG